MEQAVWEMTQLIIAPKKVFRNIYYHVGHFNLSVCFVQSANSLTETFVTRLPCRRITTNQLTNVDRNQKLLPSSGSCFHIPSVTLLPHDRCSLGIGICRWHRAYRPHRSRLRPWTLPRNLATGFDTHVLPRWKSSRQAKAGSLRPIRYRYWRRRTRIWVLL
jgi:hypothetical protein